MLQIHFPLMKSENAAQNYKSADEFFDYLGSIANQTLADVGTEWFEEADNAFRQTPDYTELYFCHNGSTH